MSTPHAPRRSLAQAGQVFLALLVPLAAVLDITWVAVMNTRPACGKNT
jgi:hypothetical protein